ncbi:hypothetical protein F4803DRAFT_502733 [Xylaria telfairii]|nr:hypothetical protein F4803DRAFT_502733 [Xylaria telfairii]
MSLIGHPTPLEGQNHELAEKLVTTENCANIATEQSQSDSTPAPKEDPLQVLVDADDEQCLIEEATILSTKELRTKEVMIEPPAIPKRNTLRTSRFLDNLRLNSIESATKSLNTTQSVYLSSEEDASSSADDYSDYEYSDSDYESSNEEPEKSPTRRRSQEVTARAVSVMFVGKPSIVELASHRRSISPAKRPQSEFFGRSVSSPFGIEHRPDYPPRKISLASMNDLPKHYPSFLNQDPFSSSPYTRRESVLRIETTSSTGSPVAQYPRTPMTPTGAFQRIQKTINLARKRSRPNLKAAAHNSASMSSLNLSNPNTSQEYQASIDSPDMGSPATTTSPVTYNQILNVARRNSIAASALTSGIMQSSATNSQPASPITPVTTKRSLLSGFNMNRRRSMKIKS